MWTLISLVLTIIYIIWLTRLINFGVKTATQIAISSALTADRLGMLVNAMPPEARERALESMRSQKPPIEVTKAQVTHREFNWSYIWLVAVASIALALVVGMLTH
jgi:hypothetical protein